MTAVCLHQPNFIPWTKLLAKIAASDVYVAYDSVQFTRTEYHNRQRLRARRGPVLLTVPVRRAKHRQLLCDVELDPTDKWRGHHLRIIEQEYRRAPFFTDIFPLVRDVYHHPHTTLVDFNLDLLGTFLTYLQIPTRIVRATDLPHHGDNTDRLIQLTAAVGGGEHITSTWGTERTYIDWHRVADAGLTIRPQHYVHPTYQQQFQPFEPHLGALDLMFAHGPDTTHTLRRSSTFPCAPTPSVTTHVARPHRSRARQGTWPGGRPSSDSESRQNARSPTRDEPQRERAARTTPHTPHGNRDYPDNGVDGQIPHRDAEAEMATTRKARDALHPGPKTSATSQGYAAALGARLRAIRHQRGLTLRQVEQESHGRLKAVVVGSYERADRAVTVPTLAELARVYGVRTDELLPHDAPPVPPPTGSGRRLRIDLQQLAALPEGQGGPLARYAAIVQAQRDDHNSTVLTIREQDLHPLAVVYDVAPGDLTQMLTDWKVLALDP